MSARRSKSGERQRNVRGSAADRRRRRAWLLETYAPELGPAHAFCELRLSPACEQIVDTLTLSVDRIEPGGAYVRGNIRPACTPCQNQQGGLIGASRRACDAGQLELEWEAS